MRLHTKHILLRLALSSPRLTTPRDATLPRAIPCYATGWAVSYYCSPTTLSAALPYLIMASPFHDARAAMSCASAGRIGHYLEDDDIHTLPTPQRIGSSIDAHEIVAAAIYYMDIYINLYINIAAEVM